MTIRIRYDDYVCEVVHQTHLDYLKEAGRTLRLGSGGKDAPCDPPGAEERSAAHPGRHEERGGRRGRQEP